MRAIRVLRGLTQAALSQQSGLSLSSYRRFEQTGRIEWISLIKVAQTLRMENDFDALFKEPEVRSLDELENIAKAKTTKSRVYKRS